MNKRFYIETKDNRYAVIDRAEGQAFDVFENEEQAKTICARLNTLIQPEQNQTHSSSLAQPDPAIAALKAELAETNHELAALRAFVRDLISSDKTIYRAKEHVSNGVGTMSVPLKAKAHHIVQMSKLLHIVQGNVDMTQPLPELPEDFDDENQRRAAHPQ